MSGLRDVRKPAAIVGALGLGGTYVILAGTAGLVLTALVLPSTKSARGIVTEKQVHDFRQSLGGSREETRPAQGGPETPPDQPTAPQVGSKQVSPGASQDVVTTSRSSSTAAGAVHGQHSQNLNSGEQGN